jgi:D-lyxose ketol-isomerase
LTNWARQSKNEDGRELRLIITQNQVREGFEAAAEQLRKAGIAVSPDELLLMEVTDFGLENYPAEGAQIITLLNTGKVGFKIIYLSEGQILPEHMHVASLGEEGKEETFRVICGTLHLFVPDSLPLPDTLRARAGTIPSASLPPYCTCTKELSLQSPDQITLGHDTRHWLRGGKGGCLTYSISSWARCEFDVFTNPNVKRKTVTETTTEP